MMHTAYPDPRRVAAITCALTCLSLALAARAQAGPETAGLGDGHELAGTPITLPAATIEGGGSAPLTAEPEDAEPPKPPPPGNSTGGFIDLNLYPYLTNVDADSVFTINILAKLPYGFQYFSLLNINNEDDHQALYDTVSYYTEHNLRWAIPGPLPFDLTIQYNMRSGEGNDRLRLGFRWRLESTPWLGDALKAIYLSYSINFHLYQFDHSDDYVTQLEHVMRLDFPYLDRRLYVAGFGDHTMGEELPGVPRFPLIMELQGGIRLIDELYAVAEFRVNDYRAPTNNVTNIGLGIEYVIKW